MALTQPAALVLLALVPLIVWLCRRAADARAPVHPLWFLLPPGAGARGGRRRDLSAILWAAIAVALVVAAAGPVRSETTERRAVVIDGSRSLALVEDPARLAAGADLVVLVRPGSPAEILDSTSIERGELAPAAGVASAQALEAGVALAARAGASEVAVIRGEVPARRTGIARAWFERDFLEVGRGTLWVTVETEGEPAEPLRVLVRDGAELVAERPVTPDRGGRALMAVPYRGPGDRIVSVTLEPADALTDDDSLAVPIPDLGPISVHIDASARATATARALSLLPIVRLRDAPGPDAVVVRAPDAPAVGRAALVVHRDAPAVAPLVAVADSPLTGLSPELLAELDAAAGALAEVRATDQVWLRSGTGAAVLARFEGDRAEVHLVDALPPVALAVTLADALHTAPLARGAPCDVVVGGPLPAGVHQLGGRCVAVHPAPLDPRPAPVTTGRALRAPRVATWPIRVALALAFVLLLVEVLRARRTRTGLALRAALGAAVVAALVWAAEPGGRRIIYLIDASASMAPAGAEALAAVRAGAEALGAGDRAGVVVFAGGARLTIPLGPPERVARWAAAGELVLDPGVDPRRTDLAAALAVAGDALGPGSGELVLVTDGHDTERGAAALEAAAGAGHALTVVPIDRGDRVAVEAGVAGIEASPGAPVLVPLVLRAAAPTEAVVRARLGASIVAERPLALAPGASAIALPVTMPDAPGSTLTIDVEVDADPVVENNTAAIALRNARQPSTLRLDAAEAAGATLDAGRLGGYDLVVLDDVPYAALGLARVAALAAFVDAGGTLLLGGGPSAFGPGGYLGTELDALSPLRSDPRAEPEVSALVLLVDRSGSMGAPESQPLAPTATGIARLLARLRPTDWLAVVSFDVEPRTLRALSPVADGLSAVPALPPARGGTDPTAALEEAARVLERAPARARRLVVVLSDGGFEARAEQAVAAAARARARGAVVLVVPVGAPSPAQRALLANLARAGGGRLVGGGEGNEAFLPALMATGGEDAWLVSQPAPAAPRLALRQSLGQLSSLTAGVFAGRVRTSLAGDAVVLADVGADPLLALRRQGAGWVVALASDLGTRWSPPGLGAELVAVLEGAARRQRGAVRVMAGAMPGSLVVSLEPNDVAMGPEVAAEIRAEVIAADDARPLILRWSEGGAYRGQLDRVGAGRARILAAGIQAEAQVADAEHQGFSYAASLVEAVAAQAHPALRRPARPTRLGALLAAMCAAGIAVAFAAAMWVAKKQAARY